MWKVPIFKPALKRPEVWNRRIATVLLHQLPQCLVGDSPLEVQVKLDLRNSLKPAHFRLLSRSGTFDHVISC